MRSITQSNGARKFSKKRTGRCRNRLTPRYQWHTGRSFVAICRKIIFPTLLDLYGIRHEADPGKTVDVFNQIMAQKGATNLAYYRRMKGLSQSQLAKASGVSIRSIQLFEQSRNNINNAQYNHLSAIAQVLGCTIGDLME